MSQYDGLKYAAQLARSWAELTLRRQTPLRVATHPWELQASALESLARALDAEADRTDTPPMGATICSHCGMVQRRV